MTVRVVVADDQRLLRAGLSGIIETAPDLTVVGEAANGREAVAAVASTTADVVLMDIRMPGMDGLEATRRIVASSNTKVLILTTFDLDEYVYEAIQAGASGFLLKDAPPTDLLESIRRVAQGEALGVPDATARLIHAFTPSGPRTDHDQARFDTLTARELDVLHLVADGLSNAEIADQLHIGIGTAKTHVGHLLMKLDARDRVQLVVLAHRNMI